MNPWYSLSYETRRQCLEHEAKAVQAAIASWAVTAGVSRAEVQRHLGYTVERNWLREPEALSVTVRPVPLYEGELPEWAGADLVEKFGDFKAKMLLPR